MPKNYFNKATLRTLDRLGPYVICFPKRGENDCEVVARLAYKLENEAIYEG